MFDFLKIFTFFSLFVIFSVFFTKHKDLSKELIIVFIIFSVIISFTGLAEIVELNNKEGIDSIKSMYKITGNFAHKNLFSQSLFYSLAFSGAGIFLFKKKEGRIISIIVSAIALILIIVLMSRAVWVGLFIAVLLTIIVYFIFIYKHEKKGKRLKQFGIIIGSLIGLLILTTALIGLVDKQNSVLTHIKKGTDFNSGSVFHRFDLWKKSSAMTKEHWVKGVGAGNWKTMVIKYGIGAQTKSGWKYPVRPHSDYLWVLTELGILGFISFLAIFGLSFFMLFRFMRHSKDENKKIFSLMLFFALIGYMTFSFFSFPKERIESQIFLHLIFAYITANYHLQFKKENKKQFSKPIILIGTLAMVALLLISTIAGQQRIKAEKGLQKIMQANKRGKPKDLNIIIKQVDEIIAPFATLDHAGMPILWYKATALARQKKLQEAEKISLEALEIHPYHTNIMASLAYVYSNMKDYENAEKYLFMSLNIHDDDRIVRKNIAVVYSLQGKDSLIYDILKPIEPKKIKDKGYNNIMKNELYKKSISLTDTTDIAGVRNLILLKSQNQKWLFQVYKKNWTTDIIFEKVLLEELILKIEKDTAYNQEVKNSLKSKLEEF